jgi:hypothetical protein
VQKTAKESTTRARGALARVPRPPTLLAAVVAAALAFVAAYFIGRATASTHEDLRAPTTLHLHRTTPLLDVLGPAAALPAAPKRAKSAFSRPLAPTSIRPSSDGKLIVGQG